MSAKTIFLGMDVWWYGDDTGSASPNAAKVTKIESLNEGMVTLAIFPPNSTAIRTNRGVRHRDDPWYQNRHDVLVRIGCWDYIDNKPPIPPPVKFAAKSDKLEKVC